MDHATIEEQQIVDRYVAGTLPAEEMEGFENHYLSCPECLDRLELAESLQRGFKRMAGQNATVLDTTRQLAVVAWLARLGRSQQAAVLATALLALAILPAGLAWRGFAEHGQELAKVRTTLEHERQRSGAASQRAAAAEKGLETSRRNLAVEQEEHAQARQQLAAAWQPRANTPVLHLDAVRDAGPGDKTANQLRLPPSYPWVILEVPVYPPFSASYRASLQNAQRRELLRIDGLQPNGYQELAPSLPASLFLPGDYVLQVEGLMPGRKPTDAGRFRFSVLSAACTPGATPCV